MSNEIDYKRFIEFVYKEFKERISKSKVEKLLNLEEDYNKDSPASLGKSLYISRLAFKGNKLDGTAIDFNQSFKTGLSIWIASNSRGKSTLFKIIKYALTGKNSIKKDIRDWIKEITLEFKIGASVFTIHIDKSSRISRGTLFSLSFEKFKSLDLEGKLDTIDAHRLFDFKGDESLTNQIESFFFNQFAFYSLKYTTNTVARDDFNRQTNSLSWATYFKTIYLESKDKDHLYFKQEDIGKQGRKIFEMILGLRLTYPINRLTLLLEQELAKLGRLNIQEESIENENKKNEKAIRIKVKEVDEELSQIESRLKQKFDTSNLRKTAANLQDTINKNRKAYREANANYHRAKRLEQNLDEELFEFKKELRSINSEIEKLKKNILNMRTYKEAGSFFSNLEVRSCPHCETPVTEDRIQNESEVHECRLCGTEGTNKRVADEEIAQKISGMEQEAISYESKSSKALSLIDSKELELKKVQRLTIESYEILATTPIVETDEEKLIEIESEIELINEQQKRHPSLYERREKLKDERAVLAYQLNKIDTQISKKDDTESVKAQLNIDIFRFALNALRKKRKDLNSEILEKLQGLMLTELKAFQLTGIAKVEIDENYDIIFIQNEYEVRFDNLNEGEKLKAKLAFYLSLIQLDIDYQLGRHPRFLIFDSPGSEEMATNSLEGLGGVLKSVNRRYGQRLQIFIGTALMDFANITASDQTTIKSTEEYIF